MKRFCFVVYMLLLAVPAAGQISHPLRLNIDVAAFRYDAEHSFLEMYYGFTRASLKFEKQDGYYVGSAVLQATFEKAGSDDQPFVKLWRVPVRIQDTANFQDKHMMGKVNYVCTPGNYRITVVARDENMPGRVDSVGLSYQVQKFHARNPMYSDIELCSSLAHINPDTTNIFYKNTLEVIPNPTLLYGKSFSNLLYYAELYNVPDTRYRLRRDIISSYGKTMQSDIVAKTGSSEARVEYGSMPVNTLPSGAYTLAFSGLDSAGRIFASASKLFYVYNPDVTIDTMMVRQVGSEIALEFAALTETELNDEFDKASYVATSAERDVWKSLAGAEAKKKFLTKFWEGRDQDKSTPENEFYLEYMKRVAEANDMYRTAYRPGWKSDRGRVYVMYGKPDQIERMSAESDTKPYEIWTYDRYQSGVQFVFVDKGGFNNFELVHSTMRNELNDQNWQRYIKTY